MYPFYKLADIKHDAGKYVEYEREANCQERRIYKKQPDLTDRDIKFFAKVSTNSKRVSFKKSKDPLQHISPVLVSYYQRRNAGISYNYSNYFSVQVKPAIQTRCLFSPLR